MARLEIVFHVGAQEIHVLPRGHRLRSSRNQHLAKLAIGEVVRPHLSQRGQTAKQHLDLLTYVKVGEANAHNIDSQHCDIEYQQHCI